MKLILLLILSFSAFGFSIDREIKTPNDLILDPGGESRSTKNFVMETSQAVRFNDGDTNFVDILGPVVLASDISFTLPSTDGVLDEVLFTNGSGLLDWKDVSDHLTETGTAVVTNKDYDIGTASDTSRVTLGQDTTTNLDLLTDKKGHLAYDTTLDTVVVNDGADWIGISGGGGGGGAAGTLGDVRVSFLTEAQFQSENDITWILCDGRSVAGSDYDTLTGSTTIPDLRGMFLRGKNNSRVDGLQDPGGERALGNYQADTNDSHLHTMNHDHNSFNTASGGSHNHRQSARSGSAGTDMGSGFAGGSSPMIGSSFTQTSTHLHAINVPNFNGSTASQGGSDSKPRNMAVNYFCKINN